jgi:nitrous oxidase accessory protein NosD
MIRSTSGIVVVAVICAGLCLCNGCGDGETIVDIPIKASEIGGTILLDMTWTYQQSPYIVVSPIIVSSGAVLTIDPGVEVLLHWKMGIAVLGSLIAEATPDSVIRFTAVDGVWNGLAFSGGENDSLSTLKHCILEYCNFAILCDTLTSPTIEHCTIQHFTNVGIYVGYHAEPPITDNDILNLAPGGATGIQCDPYAFPWIYGNRIEGHLRGIHCQYVSFTIIDSTYVANCDTGVCCSFTYNTVTVRNSHITGNLVGAGLTQSSPEIIDNVITGNEKAIQGQVGSAPYVRRNDLSSNTWTYYNLSANGLDAQQNWWGTTDSTAIAAGVWDFYDTTSVGIVDFIPILESPP